MNRLIVPLVFALSFCPLLAAQQPALSSDARQPAQAEQQTADLPPLGALAERMQALKNARTLCIKSDTVFLTVSTLERSLMKQKNWDRLGLNILGASGDNCSADLVLDVDRLHFTHIHTYVLAQQSTRIVLAAGRVRAFDGVVASGPMAEALVKVLSSARLPAQTAGADHGF